MFSRRREAEELPVSSFSDIAFLLIIFFILVTSLEQFAGFEANIPSGEKSEQTQTDEMPTIKLHNGIINYNENVLSIEELRGQLTAMNLREKAEDKRIVLLEASGQVPYQPYYEVMAAISAAGGVVGIVQEGE